MAGGGGRRHHAPPHPLNRFVRTCCCHLNYKNVCWCVLFGARGSSYESAGNGTLALGAHLNPSPESVWAWMKQRQRDTRKWRTHSKHSNVFLQTVHLIIVEGSWLQRRALLTSNPEKNEEEEEAKKIQNQNNKNHLRAELQGQCKMNAKYIVKHGNCVLESTPHGGAAKVYAVEVDAEWARLIFKGIVRHNRSPPPPSPTRISIMLILLSANAKRERIFYNI